MLLLFVKSQLSLFDTPVHIAAHVRKDGSVVKPHIRIQKVAIKQPSLFGEHHAAPEPVKKSRSKLDSFIARHGGPKALAATIMGFNAQQQNALLEQMAKVGGQDVEKLRALLGLAKPEQEAVTAEAPKTVREPFAAGIEPQKNGAVLVLGDAAKLEDYGNKHLDLGLFKYKLDARGLMLPKAKARMAEFFPSEREALPSGAYINHYTDGGASVSTGRDLSGVARNVSELKELVAEDWGAEKFQQVFGESASAKSAQAHADAQAEIEQRRRDHEAEKVKAADDAKREADEAAAAKQAEKDETARVIAENEGKRRADIEATLHQGNGLGNTKYQAFLDTLEDPAEIGYHHADFMGWIGHRRAEFESKHGNIYGNEKQEAFGKYVREYADANLSDRVKTKIAEDGPNEGDRNAEGLVFRDGRWHREDEAQAEQPTHNIVEYTTKKGKVLRGIVRTDLDGHGAAAIDPYTFRYQGGWFIREKHLGGAATTSPATAEPASEVDAEAQARAAATAAVEKSKAQAAKLREAGEKLLAESESHHDRDRLTNTARRVRFAAAAERAAADEIRIAKTMINLASAIEDGDARHLAGVSTKVAVKTLETELQRAIYTADKDLSYSEQQRQRGRDATEADIAKASILRPKWGTAGTSLTSVLDAIKGKRGAPALASKLRASDGPTPELAVELRKIVDAEQVKSLLGWWNMERLQEINRLQKLGITNDDQLREALREFVQYRGGHKPVDPIKAAERALVGQKVGVDFFPTPKTLAASMAAAAGIKPGMRVLEPSAGNGHLADAAKAAGADVDTVEISDTLRNILQAKGHNLAGFDFETYEPAVKYDAVLMNPPFSDRKDAEHIMRAMAMLKPGGKMVAIAGEGVFFGSDKKAVAFREWLAENGAEVEHLPAGTFMGADLPVQTSANARLIKMTKAAEVEAPAAGFKRSTLASSEAINEMHGDPVERYALKRAGYTSVAEYLENPNKNRGAYLQATAEGHILRWLETNKATNLDQIRVGIGALAIHQEIKAAALSRLYNEGIIKKKQVGGNGPIFINPDKLHEVTVTKQDMPSGLEVAPAQDTGPKDGDRNAEGLVFRDGRWHREGGQETSGVDEATLIELGLAREVPDGRWKYKTDINSKTELFANSKESALERATEAYNQSKPEDRLTKQQRFDAANAAEYDGLHQRYGHMSLDELVAKHDEYEAVKDSLRSAGVREFDGNGGRRTSAAVANEGANNVAEERQKLGRYIDERKKREGAVAANSEADLAEDREDLATELTRNPHSDKAKAMLAEAATKHAKAEAPASSDEAGDPEYRYADTGYIAGSRKEQAAANVIARAKRDGAQVMVQHIDWEGMEANPREAKELITKSNLFGVVPWAALRENGMEPGAGFIIDRIYAAIGTEPTDDNAQARKDYTLGLQTLRNRLEACKSVQAVADVLDDLQREYDGKMLNAEESAAYAKVQEVKKPVQDRLRAIAKERDAKYAEANALALPLREMENTQSNRKRRNWKPDADLDAQIAKLKPKVDAARAEYGETLRTLNKERDGLEEQYRTLYAMQDRIEQGAYARNKIENPLHRAWNIMGERFVNVLRYRKHKGSETFLGHMATAKAGGVKDWSWSEKDGATKAPKIKKESARFQMKVADSYKRKGGRDIKPESTMALKKQFGLRDVQSGNWVLRDEASAKFHVEHSAAAMADLADLIGVPDEQISFNGRLALAFGARGKGAAGGAASAHYEPVHRVINLTKMAGGGALAHELFHSWDNMVKEAMGGDKAGVEDFASERPDLVPEGPLRDAFKALRDALHNGEHQAEQEHIYTPSDYAMAKRNMTPGHYGLSGVAKQINAAGNLGAALDMLDKMFDGRGSKKNAKAWRTIAIAHFGGSPDGGVVMAKHGPKMSAFKKEALILDGGSKKEYYSEGREMSARAFQSWVEDRLAGMGRSNDYLSWGADNKYHRDPLTGMEWKPFPEGEERERINVAFDRLMAAFGDQQVLAKSMALW